MISSCSDVFPGDDKSNEAPADADAVDPIETSRPHGQVLFLELHEPFAESTHSNVKGC
jgi:hypothetical protein